MTRAHLPHQSIEVRGSPWIDQDELAIENCRSCGQLGEGLDHARQPIAVFSAMARVEADAGVVLDDLGGQNRSISLRSDFPS
jgi:hypothetical protein